MRHFARLFPLLVGVMATMGGLIARRFLLVDACLDAGGAWSDEARACQARGGRLELALEGASGYAIAAVVGLAIAALMWLLLARITAARRRVARPAA